MDKKQLAQLASSLTDACKTVVQKGKTSVYTAPVLLTALGLLDVIGTDPEKIPPRGWW